MHGMGFLIPPLLHAIIDDANRVAPGRSHASDGTIGDLAHQQSGGDHNPDSRGIVHAVDITNDPAHGMDSWYWAQMIARRIQSGTEKRVKYLVSNDGMKDVIFNPSVSMGWRQNGERKQDHRSHLHTSILSGAAVENSTARYFVSGLAAAGLVVPTPQKEDEMFRVVYRDGDPQLWLTNYLAKRKLFKGNEGLVEARDLIQAGVTNGAAPLKIAQVRLDAIPELTHL